jgi:hypothetical protein
MFRRFLGGPALPWRVSLLSRPYLACIGAAAALVLAAGPAVAATSTTVAPTPAQSATVAPVAKAPAQTKAPRAISCPPDVVKAATGSKRVSVPAECQALIKRKLGLAFPKGAPETGGGAEAAQVASWR